MSRENLAKEPNWKEFAVSAQRKLNLIGARLARICKENPSVDCAFMADELLKEFCLDREQTFVHPEYDDLRKLDDEVGSLIHRYHFAPFASREHLFELLQKKHSDFSIQLAIYGAFV